MATYCQPNDLIIGDIAGLETQKQEFINIASEEIEAMLGFVYTLPLGAVTVHGALILKNICRKLASGRLLMAQAASHEDTSVHAYGKSLVDEAEGTLWSIRNGQIELGAPKVESMATGGNAPTIIQGDEVSGVDAFYGWMTGSPRIVPNNGYEWKPGSY